MSGARNRRASRAIIGSACLLAASFPALPVTAQPPLRYRLEVGDRLVYERRVRVGPLEGESAARRHSEQVQLWCLAREENEILLLADLLRVVDQRLEPTRGALLHVGPRGTRRLSNEILARAAGLEPILELLPILPPVLEPGPTWLTEPDHFGRRWRCTRVASDTPAEGPVRIDFELADPSGVAEILGQAQNGSYWFDPQAGLVVRVESEWRDRSANQRLQAVTRLHARRSQDPRWCERRVHEAGRFLLTLRLEDRWLDRVTTEPAEIERILQHIDRFWSELVLGVPRDEESPLRRIAQGRRTLFMKNAALYRERADLADRWLGKPAAHWSLQTPDGETIRSETVRDRLVVECFWSAKSLWSLRSFEILRRIQERLPADTFRVVCLNIDADAEAGRRAASLCGVGLTHVLAGAPVGGQPPAELPVFRILDRESTIVGVYFGWQPRLEEKIASLGR